LARGARGGAERFSTRDVITHATREPRSWGAARADLAPRPSRRNRGNRRRGLPPAAAALPAGGPPAARGRSFTTSCLFPCTPGPGKVPPRFPQQEHSACSTTFTKSCSQRLRRPRTC
jgi:hypothetical protein